MKKIKLLILSILCVFLSINNVKAFEAFQVDVSSSFNPSQGSVNTFEHYTYDMTQIYKQGEDLYFYSNITNNTKDIKNISVEALLFDKNGKNIGVFNYCSSKDYETQFASKKMQPGETVSFTFKIVDKYLASDKYKLSNVTSFSIIDDNQYCKVGGYSNYVGKTLDEIVSSTNEKPSGSKFDKIVSIVNRYVPLDGLNVGFGVAIVVIVVGLIIGIAIWVAFGNFLNKLHFKMFNVNTPLAFVPIANSYLCVKMAFGKIVGFAYLGVTLFGGLLSLIGFGFITVIVNLFFIFAFVLDIVKLITGKYDLCYLDATNKVMVNNFDNNQGFVSQRNQTNEYGYSQDNNVKESLLGLNTNNTLDDDTTTMNVMNNNNDNNNNQNTNNIVNNNANNSNNNNNNEEESDLSKFFR